MVICGEIPCDENGLSRYRRLGVLKFEIPSILETEFVNHRGTDRRHQPGDDTVILYEVIAKTFLATKHDPGGLNSCG